MQQAHNNYEVFTGEETEAQKGKHGAGKGWSYFEASTVAP